MDSTRRTPILTYREAVELKKNKPDLRFISYFIDAINEVADVYACGAIKYHVPSTDMLTVDEEILIQSFLRHATKPYEIDDETGKWHLAHAICNALVILQKRAMEGDEYAIYELDKRDKTKTN